MGNGASNSTKDKSKAQAPDYPVQPPARPPANPPGYNEPLQVPISFYPNNVYSPSNGGGFFAEMNREIDNFDYRMTEAFDGNRYFNAVHDHSVPPAPGSIHAVTFVPSAPSTSQYPSTSHQPPPSVPQPQYPGGPVPPMHPMPQPSAVPPAYSSVYPQISPDEEKKKL